MRKPLHPWAVMALAVVLPGVGHVASRQPVRGLIFLFFMILLGAFTATTAAPGVIGSVISSSSVPALRSSAQSLIESAGRKNRNSHGRKLNMGARSACPRSNKPPS